jgi:hypothetical protein
VGPTQFATKRVPGAISLPVKGLGGGGEAHHPCSSGDVLNAWSYITPLSHTS